MPKMPRNMLKRGSMYYFRRMVGERRVRRPLETDYEEARRRLRSLKREGAVLASGNTSADVVTRIFGNGRASGRPLRLLGRTSTASVGGERAQF